MKLSILLLILCLVYSSVFLLFMVTVEVEKYKKYCILAKTITSVCFITTTVICGIYSNQIQWMLTLLPAFFLCLCGDVFLGFYGERKKQATFLFGLCSFLAAHIFFVYAFSTKQSLTWIDCGIAGCVVLLTFGLTFLKNMDTGKMKPAVLVYSFFVALSFIKGAHLWLESGTTQNWMIFIGSGLFLISDMLILFLYFYKKKHPVIHILNLATYYYGMFFLSINLLW